MVHQVWYTGTLRPSIIGVYLVSSSTRRSARHKIEILNIYIHTHTHIAYVFIFLHGSFLYNEDLHFFLLFTESFLSDDNLLSFNWNFFSNEDLSWKFFFFFPFFSSSEDLLLFVFYMEVYFPPIEDLLLFYMECFIPMRLLLLSLFGSLFFQ